MSKKKDKKHSGVEKLTKLQVTMEHFNLRAVLAVCFLAIGIIAIGIGLNNSLTIEPGWQTVEVDSTELNVSEDFVLNYDFTGTGGNSTALYKQLIALYSDASERAYQIFTKDTEFADVHNVWYVNNHVNEEIQVDEVLYQAFEKIQSAGNRCIYLAPVYVEYNRVFQCDNEVEALWYDPMKNEEAAAYVSRLAAFASDPQMIDIQLLGDSTMRLYVSDEYMAFAEENDIDKFLDFGWMTNAFIVDYFADVLVENGFTSGYIASYDGFTRNLDERGTGYTLNLFDMEQGVVNLAAKMEYTQPASLVSLRSFLMSDSDVWHYFSYSDGTVTTTFVDASDGVSKAGIDNLVGVSYDKGCVDVLLELIPVFIADEFAADSLLEATQEGVYSIWCANGVIHHTQENVTLYDIQEGEGVINYSSAYEK